MLRNILKSTVLGGGNLVVLLIVASLAVVTGLVFLLARLRSSDDIDAEKLVMYCAAGMRTPVEEIARQYEGLYGVKIEMQYGGSNTLLGQLDVNRTSPADIYLAADDFYTSLAREKGLAEEILPIAEMWPVVAVRKGNPKSIHGLGDLLQKDVKIALASPGQAAIGKAVKQRLEAAGQWDALNAQITRRGVFKTTVNEVANDVKLGAVDAGIVWNTLAAMPQYRDDLETFDLAELGGDPDLVSVAILKSSGSPASALRFARYLTARDKGLPVFKEYGFEPVEGDKWAERPEITFFCGSVNRRAVDEVIKAFEKREGVTVNTIYNGCGILTGQMRAIDQDQGGAGFPDTYMACDRYYLENVKDWFQEDADVSNADIVIAVPKGNPAGIGSLEDLTKPGVRVSVGQPEQCTIGALTRVMLQKMGIYDAVMKNVVTQTASSAMLIPSVTTKSVDATIAYITDTIAESGKVEAIRIDSPFAIAIQPFAIAKSSGHKELGRRLFRQVTLAKDNFESAGFTFVYEREGEAPQQ
jgi:molybdate transport system substrate-binding protein